MTQEPSVNADQATFWGEDAGPVWVRNMQAMDTCLAPVLTTLLQSADLHEGQSVLDVGCGAGTSSFAALKHIGPDGRVLGADISRTLLTAAEARNDSPQVEFQLLDAQTHRFAPAAFQRIISRFGVMFFADPVAAFANMHRALAQDGQVTFAAWGAIPENPFFTLPARIAKTVIGALPKSDPDAPGPFSFRDAGNVKSILQTAGFKHITINTQATQLAPTGTARDYAELMCQIGPAAAALAYFKPDNAHKEQLLVALSEATSEFQTDKGLRIPSCIHYVTAHA